MMEAVSNVDKLLPDYTAQQTQETTVFILVTVSTSNITD
jgi:hypothetical protein